MARSGPERGAELVAASAPALEDQSLGSRPRAGARPCAIGRQTGRGDMDASVGVIAVLEQRDGPDLDGRSSAGRGCGHRIVVAGRTSRGGGYESSANDGTRGFAGPFAMIGMNRAPAGFRRCARSGVRSQRTRFQFYRWGVALIRYTCLQILRGTHPAEVAGERERGPNTTGSIVNCFFSRTCRYWTFIATTIWVNCNGQTDMCVFRSTLDDDDPS